MEIDELELKFDTMEENTDLAQEYITAHNGEFYNISSNYTTISSAEVSFDDANNKFHCRHPTQKSGVDLEQITVECTDSTLFVKLAQKIEENAELFAQLEVLIRKKRKEEVKKWDIELLVQILLHQSNQKFYPYEESPDMLWMHPDSALAELGHVALILTRRKVLIGASANTGVVSHLFATLCHEVGLIAVGVAYTTNIPRINYFDVDQEELLKTQGCIGVITEHADTDSAVDTLLSSTTQYPWKVRRILIQESIYDKVMKTLEWKCNMKPTEGTVDEKLKQWCIDTNFYEDKLLIFDYTGNYKDIYQKNPNVNAIFVEAYRTSKELLALVNLYEPLCLSLWSCDVAESDEIAFSVNTPIVWVNEFGSFWGPHGAAEAYYSSVYSGIHTIEIDSRVEKLLELRDAWRKIDIRSRKAILKEAVNSCTDYENNKEKVLKLLSDQPWRDRERCVEIQNNKICIVRRDRDELYMPSCHDIDEEDVFGFLIAGGAVNICVILCDTPFKDWSEPLTKQGIIPIIFTDDYKVLKAGGAKNNWTAQPNTKVVYKSFGMIFAN